MIPAVRTGNVCWRIRACLPFTVNLTEYIECYFHDRNNKNIKYAIKFAIKIQRFIKITLRAFLHI